MSGSGARSRARNGHPHRRDVEAEVSRRRPSAGEPGARSERGRECVSDSIVGRLRACLAPLSKDSADLAGWRFESLVPASTGLDASFRDARGNEARLRFGRTGFAPAWRSLPCCDVILVTDARGRLPDPGFPQEAIAAWLDRRLGSARASWPVWDPSPPPLVVASGVPRSGTGWVKRIARSLIEIAGHDLERPGCSLDATIDRPAALQEHEAAVAAACAARVRGPRRVRLLKAHYVIDLPAVEHGAVRLLFAYRDFRDALASQLDRGVRHPPSRGPLADVPPADRFDQLVEWTLPPAVEALERAARDPSPTTLLVRYERLLADPGGGIRRIARFLGMDPPDDLVDLLVETHRFRAEAGREPGRVRAGAYHRRGVAGGWCDQLTAEQLACIARVVPDIDGLLARVDARLDDGSEVSGRRKRRRAAAGRSPRRPRIPGTARGPRRGGGRRGSPVPREPRRR